MAPKFGTSGLRGLVTELTDALVADHVRAFLSVCATGPAILLGRDLRDSSPRLAAAVTRAALGAGHDVVDCGALPTPALALAAQEAGCGAVMVTGSHIPDDRNGLKFYTVTGEIAKTDEAAILAALGQAATPPPAPRPGGLRHDAGAGARYGARYRDAFGVGALAGMRIGVYAHSSVARDLLAGILADLGAGVRELGRSGRFVPVDTEAVDADTRAQLALWAAEGGFDAIVSTDGDGDRPLLADAAGQVVAGDILGQITAQALGATVVVTPVSSNSGAALGGHFARVIATRIGSPHVIAAMDEARAAQPGCRVAGYEANGGFLLGFGAAGPAGPLPALPTRDSLLPILATLVAARAAGGVAARVAQEPARFTAADRIANVPSATGAALVAALAQDRAARAALLAALGLPAGHDTDRTDGLRMRAQDGSVLHLRPSGNAPEFRLYVEADSAGAARALLERARARVAAMVDGMVPGMRG
ncbi:MAG: phosphomannomutase [Rubellimicrobium sp.]|nr:phosphomannomutase [Rubellimicrobium sp.]